MINTALSPYTAGIDSPNQYDEAPDYTLVVMRENDRHGAFIHVCKVGGCSLSNNILSM